jgi:imidazolonepropionase-like amidohydrolase
MDSMDVGSVEERGVGSEERAGARGRGGRAAALLLAGTLMAAAPLAAQVPAAPQSRPIALTGGTIHTVSGAAIPNGIVVFDGGRITAVGADVPIPAGAERVDVTGKHVFPGLIDAYSHVGLWEIGGFDVTIDLNELGRINPNVRAEVAVNPESRHIGIARSGGVLVTLASPEGGLISGMAAAMALDGWTWEQMTLKSGAALVVQWPSPMQQGGWGQQAAARPAVDPETRYQREIGELREAFAAARAYRTAHAAPPARGARPHPTDARWAAMVPVLEGRVPVIVEANELRQIQDAISWAESEGVRLVIRGGRDAGYVAEHLARKQIPVLLTSVLDAPSRSWEPYDAAYSLPGRLYAAGVRFAITGGANAAYAYRLPQEAGAAIAFGLPADEALRAVTLSPARLLGIDDRVGSLEPGKDATLLITTGNPLEYSSVLEQAYIGGRRIDMRDMQRQLYEKYRERNRQEAARQ